MAKENNTEAPLVCTVLPTYNERENITPLVEGILAHAVTPHVVLVIDDDSPDGTWAVVDALAARHNAPGAPRIFLERRVGAKGLTTAIQRGIDLAIYTLGADIVTWMDCDLSMPPADVPQLVRAIRDRGADIAVGSRWVPGGADVAHGRVARTLSLVINGFAMALISPRVRDYTSGFIGARASALSHLRLRGDYGEYCIDFLGRALRAGYRIEEIPYRCVPRTAGASKTGVNLWDYLLKGRKYVAAVWRVKLMG